MDTFNAAESNGQANERQIKTEDEGTPDEHKRDQQQPNGMLTEKMPGQCRAIKAEQLLQPVPDQSTCDLVGQLLQQLHVQDENSTASTTAPDKGIEPLSRHRLEETASGHRSEILYCKYESELQMQDIMTLIQKDLSEPYSIYTYRYFISNWPELCFLAMDTAQSNKIIGAIICKLEKYADRTRGYIAMLAVNVAYRRKKIACNLVIRSIQAMKQMHAEQVVLETEVINKAALQLYENLGFVRAKRLFRYYLNGFDAFRLKLYLK